MADQRERRPPAHGRRVYKPRDSSNSDGTIRVSAEGSVSGYLTRVTKMVKEDGVMSFKVTGTGTAIENTVRVAEVIKRSFPNVHQLTLIGVRENREEFEPRNGGAENVEVLRTVSYVEISFSLNDDLDKRNPGYQAPINQSLLRENIDELLGGNSRARLHRRNQPRRQQAPVLA